MEILNVDFNEFNDLFLGGWRDFFDLSPNFFMEIVCQVEIGDKKFKLVVILFFSHIANGP